MSAVSRHIWKLRGGQVFEPAPYAIMGIVNITPDSFYDGGKHVQTQDAVTHALNVWREGAHILDFGAESSRPGAEALSPEQEKLRLMPVLQGVQEALAKETGPRPYISVDTYHAATATAALEASADIINDISACSFDAKLLDVIVNYAPGYVLMHASGRPTHMQKNPQYANVVDEVRCFFEQHLHRLTKAGLPEEHIVLDPGIGFGKTLEHNVALLQNISVLQGIGRPLLVGLSMKSVLRGILGVELLAPDTATVIQEATQAATALLAAQGVPIHRVHHVAQTTRTLRLVHALCLHECSETMRVCHG